MQYYLPFRYQFISRWVDPEGWLKKHHPECGCGKPMSWINPSIESYQWWMCITDRLGHDVIVVNDERHKGAQHYY